MEFFRMLVENTPLRDLSCNWRTVSGLALGVTVLKFL